MNFNFNTNDERNSIEPRVSGSHIKKMGKIIVTKIVVVGDDDLDDGTADEYNRILGQYQDLIYNSWHDVDTRGTSVPLYDAYDELFNRSRFVNPLWVDWHALVKDKPAFDFYLNEIIFILEEQLLFWRLDPKVIYNQIYIFMQDYLRTIIEYRSKMYEPILTGSLTRVQSWKQDNRFRYSNN